MITFSKMKTCFIWQGVLLCLCLFTVLTLLTLSSSRKNNLLLELVKNTISQKPVQLLNGKLFESKEYGIYKEEYKFDFPDPSPSVVKSKHFRVKRDESGVMDAKKISAHNIKTDKLYAKYVNADIVKAEQVKAIVISIGRAFSIMKATSPTGSPDTLVLNRNGPDPTDTAVTIVLEREGRPVSINGHRRHESEKHKLLNLKNAFVNNQQSKNTKTATKTRTKQFRNTRLGTATRTRKLINPRLGTATRAKQSTDTRSGTETRERQSPNTGSRTKTRRRQPKNTSSGTNPRARTMNLATQKLPDTKQHRRKTARMSLTNKSDDGEKRKSNARKSVTTDSYVKVKTRPASTFNKLKTNSNELFQKLKGQPQTTNVFRKPLILKKQSSNTNVFVRTARQDLTTLQKKRLIVMHWKKKMKEYKRRQALFDKGLSYPHTTSHGSSSNLFHKMQQASNGKNTSNLFRLRNKSPRGNQLMKQIKARPKHLHNNSLTATIQVPFQISSSKLVRQPVQIPRQVPLNPTYTSNNNVMNFSAKGIHAPSPSSIPGPRVFTKTKHGVQQPTRFLVTAKNTSPYLRPIFSKIQKDLDRESSIDISSDESIDISSDESIDFFENEFESSGKDDLSDRNVALNAFVKRKPHFIKDNSEVLYDKTEEIGLFDDYDSSDEKYEWDNSDEDEVEDDKMSVVSQRTRMKKTLPSPNHSNSKTRLGGNVEVKNSDESYEYYSDDSSEPTLLGDVSNSIKNTLPSLAMTGFKNTNGEVEIMTDDYTDSDDYSYEYSSDDSGIQTRNVTREVLKSNSGIRKYRNLHDMYSESDISSDTDSHSQKQLKKNTKETRENFFTESAEDWFYDSESSLSEFYSSTDKKDSTFILRQKIT